MTEIDTQFKRNFCNTNIAALDHEIWQRTLLQKGYAAGGDLMAEQLRETTAILGSRIAAREVFQQELDELGPVAAAEGG